MKIRGQSIEPRLVRIGRNESWFASARLAVSVVILWAPTTLHHALREPLNMLFIGSVMLLWRSFCWALTRFVILIAGLCGVLREVENARPKI